MELNWQGVELLPLIYCWRCPAAFEPLRYHFDPSGSITIDYVNRAPLETDDFPYENYPDEFPEVSVDLTPMSAEEESTLWHFKELALSDYSAAIDYMYADEARSLLLDAHHQVLGTSFWYQVDLRADCHLCGQTMFHLATICDDSFSEKPFVDNIGVQTVFFACGECHAIAALQDCD